MLCEGGADAARAVAEVEQAGGRALAIRADAADPQAVRDAVARAIAVYGRLDILVNNAGISVLGAPEAISFEDYQRVLAVNVTGVFIATQEALRHMGTGGRVIHVGSSMVRYAGFGGASVYTLAKGTVARFTRGLVRDLGPRGITVNTVHPGPTASDMNLADGPVADIVRSGLAVGRMGTGEDIASLLGFLASPQAALVTGADRRRRCGYGPTRRAKPSKAAQAMGIPAISAFPGHRRAEADVLLLGRYF